MDRTNAERQRRYIARLKAAAARKGVTNGGEAALTDEIDALRQKVATLERQLAQARPRPAAGGRAGVQAHEARIIQLEGEVARLRLACEAEHDLYVRALDAHAGFTTRAEYNSIVFWVHSDREPDRANKDAIHRRDKAVALLNACKGLMVRKKERAVSAGKPAPTQTDWAAMKRATTERRRAQRAARKAARAKPASPKALR